MKPKWVHGSAVKDGKVKFLSVSAVERADSCLRDWYYTYVEGKKEPPTKHKDRGDAYHKEAANYLKTGIKTLSTPLVRGLHMFPPPGNDLFVEYSLVPTNENTGNEDLTLAPLRASGVPFVGAVDLMHERHINYGGSDVEDTKDPEGTVEVCDWKFPSRMDFTKQNHELPKLIQMAGYGTYVFRVSPATKFVRLSHGYMPVQGNPRKATIRVDRSAIEPTWNHVEGVTRSIKDVAKETDANKVDANTRSCYRYGRTCMHAPYCSAKMHNSLASLIGQTAASNLLKPKENSVALLPTNKNTAFKPHPSQLLAQNGANPAVALEMQRLKDEEKAKQDKEAQAKREEYDALLKVCAKIQYHDCGFPTLTGDAAQIYYLAGGQSVAPGTSVKGSGELEAIVIDDVEMIPQLLAELEDRAKQGAPMLLPPDAPPPAPVVKMEIAAPVADSAPVIVADSALASVTAEPKRKRRTKAEMEAEAEVISSAGAVSVTYVSAVLPVQFFVDCVAMGAAYERFEPHVAELNVGLSKECGAVDVRCAPNDGPLGFGRWKGVIAAALREKVLPNLAPGNYVYDARGSELAEVVAEELKNVCLSKGWLFVRGMK